MLDPSKCATPGCGRKRYHRKELCKYCCDKYIYAKSRDRAKRCRRPERAIPDKDRPVRNVVQPALEVGVVKIDGLFYKIGVLGKAFYYADEVWKLSSRPAQWVAEQIAKTERAR